MGLKERLQAFARSKGLSDRAFEITCGLSNGFMNKASENTRRSSLDRVSAAFADLNVDWVLTGEGSMLRADGAASTQHLQQNGCNSPYVVQRYNAADAQTVSRLFDIIEEKDRQIARLLDIMGSMKVGQ